MEEKKTKSTGKTVAIIILSILLVGALGFIGYDKVLKKETKKETTKIEKKDSKKNNTEQKETTNVDKTTADKGEQIKKSKCTGTYYGEYIDKSGQITVELKYTYILNEDGTYTADLSGISRKNGVYTINDNTISLTSLKDTAGPREEDPHYVTADYVIADDCSYIIYNDNTITFKINRK